MADSRSQWAQEQVEKYLKDFDAVDSDKNGSLSLEEVSGFLEKEGFRAAMPVMKIIFEHLDTDGDKKISRDEFKGAMGQIPEATLQNNALRKRFSAMDKDGNGILSGKEIKAALSGEGLQNEQILQDVLKSLAKDDNAKINYEEFLDVVENEAELALFKVIFEKLDKDGNGSLDSDEIYAAFSTAGVSGKKAMKLVSAQEADADGKINYLEFLKLWKK